MVDAFEIFVSIFVLAFGIFMMAEGIFTTYFGSGKSRTIGVILTIIGLVTFLIFLYGIGLLPIGTLGWKLENVLTAIVAVIATVVGLLAAVGIFLVAIMKS